MLALRKLRPSHPLRLMVAASVVAPIAIFGYFAAGAYQEEFSRAEQGIRRSSDIVYENANKVLETHRLVLDRVVEMLDGLTDEELREREVILQPRLQHLVASMPQADAVLVMDREGDLVVHSRGYVGDPRFKYPPGGFSDRDYFLAAFVGDRFHVGSLRRSRLSGEAFFPVSMRLSYPDGSFRGVVMLSVPPDYFDRYRALVAPEPGAAPQIISLMQGDGRLLSNSPRQARPGDRVPREIALAVGTAAEIGTVEIPGIDNLPTLIAAVRKLDHVDVYAVAAVPISTVREAWRKRLAPHLWFGVPTTILLFTLAMQAFRRALRTEKRAAQEVEEIKARMEAEQGARQSAKLESLGKLTGGVAHDFNNLLAVIVGNCELLKSRVPPRAQRMVENILRAAERGEALTRQLLSFSRRQPIEPKVIDVPSTVERLGDLIRPSLRGDINFSLQVEDDVWAIEIDPGELEIAVLNLAVNARDAMPKGGDFTIRIFNRIVAEGELPSVPTLCGEFVALEATDTGHGMPGPVLERAFEPFYTTKDIGRGSGLGLSQVYGFALQSGGAAQAESQEGAWTRVTILLPRSHREVEEQDETGTRSAPAPVAGTRILMVDDNIDVAEVTADMLRDVGYEVDVVDRGQKALDAIGPRARAYDLLISDLVMPDGVDGLVLAREARRRNPGLPVLLMTGYSDAADEAGELATVLPKPVKQTTLAEAVRRALDEGTEVVVPCDQAR